jgi:uncharacterized protein DUF6498
MVAVSADSTRFLLLSNALAAGMALILRWPLETLLWPYWIQSVIIGWYSRQRVLALKSFSTDGLTMNDQPVPETVASLRKVAGFFTLHYGFFHAVYLAFLVQRSAALSTWADVLMHYVIMPRFSAASPRSESRRPSYFGVFCTRTQGRPLRPFWK